MGGHPPRFQGGRKWRIHEDHWIGSPGPETGILGSFATDCGPFYQIICVVSLSHPEPCLLHKNHRRPQETTPPRQTSTGAAEGLALPRPRTAISPSWTGWSSSVRSPGSRLGRAEESLCLHHPPPGSPGAHFLVGTEPLLSSCCCGCLAFPAQLGSHPHSTTSG